MGRDLTCSTEVIGIINYVRATGVPFRVTSTFRPGAITAAGNPSRHGRKLAVDLAGPTPCLDCKGLLDLFEAFVPVEAHLNELILNAAPYNIKRGKRVRPYARSLHRNHLHVAVDPGVNLLELAPLQAAESDDTIDDLDGREDMAEPVDALAAPGGGVWVLTRDGGVRSYDAPFHGSYPGLPEEVRNDPGRTFVAIEERDDGAEGYMLRSAGDELYRFP